MFEFKFYYSFKKYQAIKNDFSIESNINDIKVFYKMI